MQEQLISVNTAKLAREKGFNEICKYLHTSDSLSNPIQYNRGEEEYFKNNDLNKPCIHHTDEGDILHWSYAAPTQSLLAKWLREIHNIHIEIFWNSNLNCKYMLQVHTKYAFCEIDMKKQFKTYEEALEVGLLRSLNLIK